LTAKWINWWGGGSYGPRLLADITPLLCLFLYPSLERMQPRPLLKSAVAVLIGLSISLHALRPFAGGDWNGHPFVDWHPERLWSWADSPIVYYSKNTILDAVAEVKGRLLLLPTSRNAPHLLAASYHLKSVEPGTTVSPGAYVFCRVDVVNTGGAIWLDRAQREKGEVRLRWRWFKEEPNSHLTEGGWILGHNVLPGQTYEFTLEIAAPGQPGTYQLELGLISVHVTSFADQGIVPLRLHIQAASSASRG
jgi:hypothetical protein